jgi:hypothetical protein
MTKRVLTIFLTALLFLSAIILGCATVFRIDNVTMVATVISEESKDNVEQFREDLVELYKDKSIFSAKQRDMAGILNNYPYFQVAKFTKAYPDKIVITIEEEAEVYAVENENGEYFILSATGTVLDIRSSGTNRLDNADNVYIKGLTLGGDKGGALSGDNCWDSIFLFCQVMDESLGGIRSNVLSVELLSRMPETFCLIRMREGINIYVGNHFELTAEKAQKAMEEYMVLSDEERMTGRLTVHDIDGQVFVGYSPENEFED